MSHANYAPWSIAASWKLTFRAVAIPALVMAYITLIFFTVVMIVQKRRSENSVSFRGRQVTH